MPQSCPDQPHLQQLIFGDVPDAERQLLEQHVLACNECALTLESFSNQETLSEMLRSQDVPEHSAAVEALLDRVKRRIESARQEPITQGLGGDRLDPSSLTFLAPSQADGEIGRLGNYRIVRILGHGGMGVVFEAEDLRLSRPCAIKAMLPEIARKANSTERFLREARSAARLEHENIVAIYQVDEVGDVPFIAMPLLAGASLEDRLKSDRPVDAAMILQVARETAAGLAVAHERGLIHRDIKPANIWLEHMRNPDFPEANEPAFRVKILDFGLARVASGEQHLTQSGVIVGTPAYMAPEQARGETVDARADLFSLGCVLYRLSTGKLPFQGDNTMSTLMALATAEPVPPIKINPTLPPGLSDLIMSLLCKDAGERPASARDVQSVIQAIEAGNPISIRRTPRRRPVVAAAILFACVCVVAAVVIFWPTPRGTVRVEINDPDIQVAFDKDGATFKGTDTHEIRLAAGTVGLKIKRGDLEFETDKFTLRKNVVVTLKVELLAGKVQVTREDQVVGERALPKIEPVARPRPIWNAGQFALRFSQSYIDVPTLERDQTSPITMEAWVRTSGAGGTLLMRINGKAPCQFFFYRGNLCGLERSPTTDFHRSLGANKPMDPRSWMHVAYVIDGREARLFVNGKDAGRTVGNPPNLFEGGQTRGSWIGAEYPLRHFYYHGDLAGLRVSKVARYDKEFLPAKRFETDAETLALYHCDEGQGQILEDVSGNGHHGKIVGATWIPARDDKVSRKIAPRHQFPWLQSLTYAAADISADGRFVLAGRFNGTTQVWDTETGNMCREVPGYSRFSPDGAKIISNTSLTGIDVFDRATGAKEQSFDTKLQMYNFHIARSGNRLQYMGPNEFQVWDWSLGKKLCSIPWKMGQYVMLDLVGGQFVVQKLGEKEVYLDATTGERLKEVPARLRDLPDGWGASADGKRLGRGGHKMPLEFRDRATNSLYPALAGAPRTDAWTLSDDGRRLLAFDKEVATVDVWDTDTGRHLGSLTTPEPLGADPSFQLARDGSHAIVFAQKTLCVYRLP